MRCIIIITIILSVSNESFGDGTLTSWGPRDLVGMTQERFENAKTWTADFILQRNLTLDEWPETYLLLVAANSKKDKIIGLLIDQLTNSSQTKLTNTSRLIIWERIVSGDIVFEGKGLQINDDLFSVAGRANWILRNLTGKDFGHVRPSSTIESLKLLKDKWSSWHTGANVDEFRDPYESADKGLSEIKSIEALEGIIVSLKPTTTKTELIKACLKNVYGLDKIPDDPGSSAQFCNPDTYSNMYLSKLTEIKDLHDHKWWTVWWEVNKTKLVWDKDLFVVKN